jgi:hypothetical protein
MDENTTKLIRERFDSLPKMVQDVILSSDYENSLLEIGKQYQLNVEQLGMLEQETTLTMMGLTPLKDFETELIHQLNVDKEKGSQIVKDIDEKVFLRIRDLLKLMNTGELDETPNEEVTEETQMKVGRIDSMMPKKVDAENLTKDARADVQTLSNAGIEIIPEKLEIPTAEKTPSILAQKLSAPMQTPAVRTDHTLENLTKTVPATYPKNGDPYRLPPE